MNASPVGESNSFEINSSPSTSWSTTALKAGSAFLLLTTCYLGYRCYSNTEEKSIEKGPSQDDLNQTITNLRGQLKGKEEALQAANEQIAIKTKRSIEPEALLKEQQNRCGQYEEEKNGLLEQIKTLSARQEEKAVAQTLLMSQLDLATQNLEKAREENSGLLKKIREFIVAKEEEVTTDAQEPLGYQLGSSLDPIVVNAKYVRASFLQQLMQCQLQLISEEKGCKKELKGRIKNILVLAGKLKGLDPLIIAAGLRDISQQKSSYEEMLKDLSEFIKSKEMPVKLLSRAILNGKAERDEIKGFSSRDEV